MKLPSNGAAKSIRSYAGSLFVFLFIVGIIITLIQFPVLESNKEIVLMLIGSIAASIPILISTISGTIPDDVNALKSTIEKKENQIDFLVREKDRLEGMIIDLQKQILDNYDNTLDRIILGEAIKRDLKTNPPKGNFKNDK